MGHIAYNVPMRRQEQNPICWIACVAMITSFKRRTSLGIGEFTGGFDPSNSSIPDPVNGWEDFYRRLEGFGFRSVNPRMSPSAAYVEDLLRRHGPWMLTHYSEGFPYGAQWSATTFDPTDTHAIVITGIDTRTGQVKMNNPWGDVNQTVPINAILSSISMLIQQEVRSIAYM
jgi:hypothetical protein